LTVSFASVAASNKLIGKLLFPSHWFKHAKGAIANEHYKLHLLLFCFDETDVFSVLAGVI